MPDLGKTTDGASQFSDSTDRRYGTAYTAAENGTLASGSFRASLSGVGSSAAKVVVYLVSGGSLYATSDEVTVTGTTETLYTAPFSGAQAKALVNGTAYHVDVMFADPGAQSFQLSRDNTGNASQRYVDTYSDGPSDPIGAPTNVSGPVDVYVTYTTDGGDVFIGGLHGIEFGVGPVTAARLNGGLQQ